MANATQDVTNYGNVLKIFYEGLIREQLNNEVWFLNKIEHQKKGWSGKQIQFPMHTQRNWGVGARADYGTLPTAQYEQYQSAVISAKYNYGRIRVTGPVIAASANDRGAFARAVKSEIEAMVRNLRVDLNRQLMGAGNGHLCLTSSALTTGDTVVAVDTPGARYIKPGMKVTIGASDSDYGTVTTVDSTTQFTLSSSANKGATANNDPVKMYGSGGSTAECMGLQGCIDDGSFVGTFQNLSRTTYPDLKATVIARDTGGATQGLTESVMYRAYDAINEKSGGNCDMIVAHHASRRALMEVLDGQIVYAPQTIEAGVTHLTFNGVPIYLERHAPYNWASSASYIANSGVMFFVDSSTFKWCVLKDFHWADQDGSVLSRVADKDAFEAYLAIYSNLVCDRPNANSALVGFTVSGLLY